MREQLGFWCEADEKVQTYFMMALAGILEEVFSDAQELPAFDDLIQFFLQFSNDGRRRMFTDVDAAAGKGPELILHGSMKKDCVTMFDDGRGPELETRAT